MNEKQIVQQLTVLKTIQPSKTILKEIKKNVYYSVGFKPTPSILFGFKSFFERLSLFFLSLRTISYGIIVAVCIVTLLAVFYLFPNRFYTLFLYSKLVFASTQYEKASLALADSANRFQNKTIDTTNVWDVSQSLDLTNTELSRLKLKGESGMYTAQDCHLLYQQYLVYLKKEYVLTQGSFPAFQSQIETYEEQAEKKLHMYHNL